MLVTAGLELDGGGRALVGRLLAQAGSSWAADRGVGFEVVSLGTAELPGTGLELRTMAGNRKALAATVWRRQLNRHPPALLFDLLGLSRVQALLPAAVTAPYGVMLYGIEVWRPLSVSARRALSAAQRLISISRHTLERARPFLPTLAGPPSVLPLALEDRPPHGEVDHALLSRVGEGFALIVGRMATSERYKGHDELLAALAQLPHQEARLVVAGQGDDRIRLEALANRLGIASRVTFTGFVSEATLAELYRACGALVMVSMGEGFGLVYLEAMRTGKPTVAARGSAAEEVVVDGETGVLVPPGDPQALAQALSILLCQPSLARSLGEAGRRRYEEHFTAAAFYDRLAVELDFLTASG